jgi:hypothetical protein
MGLVLNLIIQTIVWYGFIALIIFGAAGTIDYTGGWLYLDDYARRVRWRLIPLIW